MWDQLGLITQRTNDAWLLTTSLLTTPILAYLDGRLDDAVSGAEAFIQTHEDLTAPAMAHLVASLYSWRPLLHMGRGEEALAASGEWADLPGVDTPEGYRIITALMRAHLGQTAEAREVLQRQVAEPFLNIEDENLSTYALVWLLELAILVGDRGLCSIMAERLAPAANLSTVYLMGTCPARHLGAAAALLGEHDRAREHYRQALEAAAKIRFRPEIALTRLQLCELLLDQDPEDRSEALEHLDFAIGEFRDMKMQPSLERALGHRDILTA